MSVPTPPSVVRPYPNPVIPGFNPDPSIVLVDGVYHLVTSTFEYLPGLPIYRSTDLVEWTHVGNVATRPEQVRIGQVPTGTGVYAPTIRHHDGLYHVVVSVVLSTVGCVVFTASDPSGPWSDGLTLQGVDGIDPDLAWDAEGTAYLTFSGTDLDGGGHTAIRQVRMDLRTGVALEKPRTLWSGTGLKFPEAPHLYQRGDQWYLVIAEGGTERGHAVSVARGPSPEGPFTPHPDNPVLSARSTSRPVQNTGHADLVTRPDGGTAMVLLGMRPLGATSSFSPLGRETFLTDVDWVDDWPVPQPVEPGPGRVADEEAFGFVSDSLDDPGWLGVRQLPAEVAAVVDGRLEVTGGGRTLADLRPHLVGRRQRHHRVSVSTCVDASGGAGGLGIRYDDRQWFALEVSSMDGVTSVVATASLSGLAQIWSTDLLAEEVRLRIEMVPPPTQLSAEALNGDRIRLLASADGREVLLAELDGRYWSAETCTSFTGRVICLFATRGTVAFADYRYRGSDGSDDVPPASRR